MAKYLVLGGAKPGIGQAISDRLLNDGHEVLATYEPEDEAELASYIHSKPFQWIALDSRQPTYLDTAFGEVEQIDGIVNAEFFFYMEDSESFDITKWNRSLSVNVTLPKFVGHKVLSAWPTCASVVFITSSEANTGSFGAHAYAASKAAVHNLTKSLANVSNGACRFNSVAAGWIGGVMDTDEVFNMSRRVTPLGRLGSPQEIASVAAWLLSNESTFINGATIFADGGYTGVDTISKFEFESEFGAITHEQ